MQVIVASVNLTSFSHFFGGSTSMNDATRGGWLTLENCPGCCSSRSMLIGTRHKPQFKILDRAVEVPGRTIQFYSCQECGLVYKNPQPSKGLLDEVFNTDKVNPWGKRYSYKAEVAWISSMVGGSPEDVDLLDIGAADGGLLLALRDTVGRRSAMDVADFGASAAVSEEGEFIRGWLDDADLKWGGRPYSMVTCFDIFEHLHRPGIAFQRLAEIVSVGDMLLVETGDADFWSSKKNFGRWWYSDLLEHNVFWNAKSLEVLGAESGFVLRSLSRVQHKTWRERGALEKSLQMVKIAANFVAPGLYQRLGKACGVSVAAHPRSPFPKDHLRAVFVRR